ncbi:MAG: hypothetical protein H0V29_03515 [Thermoleophilaceae bacterium]|nr:hypothetical protein [Thermoleophilaceae bacterium]
MNRLTLALVATTTAIGCSSALGAPTTVNLRIEGPGQTYFEGPVTTDARSVSTAAGGTHVCDGTNNGAHPSAGPTVTGALETAEDTGAFSWDGRYGNFGIDDFLVERIGADGAINEPFGGAFWYVVKNRVGLQTGGCQEQVGPGDQVLFSRQDFGVPNQALTAASNIVGVGRPLAVQVRQYGDDGVLSPSAGASVAGATTDAGGNTSVAFDSPGLKTFKATRAGAIRSNAVSVCVPVAGQSDCGAATPGAAGSGFGPGVLVKDSKAPRVSISSVRNGRTYRKRGPRRFAGRADEDTALLQVYLKLRRKTAAGCQYFSAKREVWTRRGSCRRARFIRLGDKAAYSYLLPKAPPAGRYTVDVKALDRAQNADTEQVKFKVTK